MTTAPRSASQWSCEDLVRLCAWSPERAEGFLDGLANPSLTVANDGADDLWDLLDGNPDPEGRRALGVLTARQCASAAAHAPDDLSSRSPEELRGFARFWEGTSLAEPATAALNDWEWDPELPVEAFVALWGTRADVEAWFAGECRDSMDDGRDGYWDLLVEDVREPVYVQFVDGGPQVWDGWHRIAALIVKGAETVAAVVGRPSPFLAPSP